MNRGDLEREQNIEELRKIAFEYYPKFLELLGASAGQGAKK